MAWLKHWFETHYVEAIPGLASVIAIIETLAPRLSHNPSHEPSAVAWLYLMACGATIYLIGSSWDTILFDPLFSVKAKHASPLKRIWWGALAPFRWLANFLPPARSLREARLKAAEVLNKERAADDLDKLYKTAARLASAQDWKEKIETLLDGSKTARSFLFPLLLLAIFRYRFNNSSWPFPPSVLSLLWRWQWDAALFAIALLGYIWLRVVHMTRLYNLTTSNAQSLGDGDSFKATYLIPAAELPYLLPK